MMEDVLVHVRDFQVRTRAADYGVRLAAAFGASVTGIYVCPRPPHITPAYGSEGITAAAGETARRLVNDAVASKASFVDWATSLGVPRASWLVAAGHPEAALAYAATRHDLLVLDGAEEPGDPPWDVTRTILKAAAPCLLVPHRAKQFSRFERIAIGWNGSPEAMRAIRSALPMLRGTRALLLCGEGHPTRHGAEWIPPFDIKEYLEQHDVIVEERAVLETRVNAGGVLLEEALDFDADLFVMGAYGRSRFSEWTLGGATRYALAWADIPVLLHH